MRLIILTMLTMTFSIAIGQVNMVANGYHHKFNIGRYFNQSSDSSGLYATSNIIAPQRTISVLDNKTALLFPPKHGLLLFSALKNRSNASKLLEPTLVQIDTVFYNQIYRNHDSTLFSFDVWYAIKINDEVYYIDDKPHRFLAFQYKLPYHKQLFSIYGQLMGYDNYYDNGYPNNFHVVVFSIKSNTITMLYASDQLPFDYGDEFWDITQSMKYEYIAEKNELRVEMYGIPNYNSKWTGKEWIQE